MVKDALGLDVPSAYLGEALSVFNEHFQVYLITTLRRAQPLNIPTRIKIKFVRKTIIYFHSHLIFKVYYIFLSNI